MDCPSLLQVKTVHEIQQNSKVFLCIKKISISKYIIKEFYLDHEAE